MRIRRLVLVLALALAACGGAAVTAGPQPASLPAATASSATGLLEQWKQAYEVRSLDALALLYVQTSELVVVRQGQVIHGWEAFRAQTSEFLARQKEIRLKIAGATVVPLGDSGALVAAQIHRTYGDGVTTRDEEGALTLSLRKDGDAWRIVAEHLSLLPVNR